MRVNPSKQPTKKSKEEAQQKIDTYTRLVAIGLTLFIIIFLFLLITVKSLQKK